jgi:NSS family neurotransmitter:Na+ symporter
MLPLGGLAIALFAGWVMASADTADELNVGEHTPGYRLWRVLVRFVAPAGVILFFLHSLGIF